MKNEIKRTEYDYWKTCRQRSTLAGQFKLNTQVNVQSERIKSIVLTLVSRMKSISDRKLKVFSACVRVRT